MVLWAMSLWAAMSVVTASHGFLATWTRYGLKPGRLVAVMAGVWVVGWTVLSWRGVIRVDPGLPLLFALGCFELVRRRGGRPGVWAATLGLSAAWVRALVPFSIHQASLLPVAAIESVGVGVAGGVALGDPLMSGLVGLIASGIASAVAGMKHGPPYEWGRHDLAAAMMAALSGWLAGWLVEGIRRQNQRRRLDPGS